MSATPGTPAAPWAPYTTVQANQNLDTWIPGSGRTVADVPQYLANNAVFNVADYGALGNGSADDTAAIQSAIAAAGATGGVVSFPPGRYVVSTSLIIPPGVSLVGAGAGNTSTSNTCRLLWTGASGFCLKAGNTHNALSYGISIENLGINIATTTAHGIWLYGVADCSLRNVYIEGQGGTTSTIGVQIDGADISAFFITLQNVTCNHVFKGFVHTTTGTTKPTQVTGITCTAFCDDTVGSMGVDVQNIGGTGCGDGVTYLGGNVEACAIGIHLAGSGTTILGMRFENSHSNIDLQFDTLARSNQVFGGNTLFTLSDLAASRTNQVFGVPKNPGTPVSQQNLLDDLAVWQNLTFKPIGSTGDDDHNVTIDTAGGYKGRLFLQAGGKSGAFGGAMNLYGHAHASHPGDVVAGISSGSGGKFRVNGSALDGGTDYLVVDTSTGELTQHCATSLLKTAVALNNGAAAAVGTLTNAPTAGNPTKWIPINDNGTTRYLPAW